MQVGNGSAPYSASNLTTFLLPTPATLDCTYKRNWKIFSALLSQLS